MQKGQNFAFLCELRENFPSLPPVIEINANCIFHHHFKHQKLNLLFRKRLLSISIYNINRTIVIQLQFSWSKFISLSLKPTQCHISKAIAKLLKNRAFWFGSRRHESYLKHIPPKWSKVFSYVFRLLAQEEILCSRTKKAEQAPACTK